MSDWIEDLKKRPVDLDVIESAILQIGTSDLSSDLFLNAVKALCQELREARERINDLEEDINYEVYSYNSFGPPKVHGRFSTLEEASKAFPIGMPDGCGGTYYFRKVLWPS